MNVFDGFGNVRLGGRAFGFLSLSLFLNGAANAQWTVVHLNPAGATESMAFDISGGQQVGWARVDGVRRACLWSGTAASWVDLHPAGATSSWAWGVGGGQQAGTARVQGFDHASLWSGTAASWVDLHPAGTTSSWAYGVGDGQQVGSAYVSGVFRASLWTGSAGSLVNLHPAWATSSEAFGVGGGQQVGYVTVQNVERASLWSGTAASWVNLHPAGATESYGRRVSGGQQVGYAYFGDYPRASLWSGSAASWVDLTPAGAYASYADGVDAGRQVGTVYFGGYGKASLWSGTAASWVDLSAFLPPSALGTSSAWGISHDEDFTYVIGGWQTITVPARAVMWVAAHNFGPMDFSIFRGTLVSGGLAELIDTDDQRLVVRNGTTQTPIESPVTVRADAVAPFALVSELKIKLEAQVSSPGLQQGIDVFDYFANAWVNVDVRNASFNADGVATITLSNPNRFIQAGTRAMRAQLRYRVIGSTISWSWQAKIDQVRWELTP